MDIINQILASDHYAKYIGVLSMICMVSGYACILLAITRFMSMRFAMPRFMSLGNERQTHGGGYAAAFMTLLIGVCLVGFQNYVDFGRTALDVWIVTTPSGVLTN